MDIVKIAYIATLIVVAILFLYFLFRKPAEVHTVVEDPPVEENKQEEVPEESTEKPKVPWHYDNDTNA